MAAIITKSKAEKCNDCGRQFFNNSQYKDAIEQYTKALGLNEDIKYFKNRAICYFILNEFEKSEKDCRNALKINKSEVKPLYFLGQIYMKYKKYNEAISYLMKALYFNNDISNTVEIENMLKKARKEKFEEEERTQEEQEIELLSLLESLLRTDFDDRLHELPDSESADLIEKYEINKKLLTDLFLNSSGQRSKRSIPDFLCGKITLELMKDPVITPSGITYDREEIIQHLRRIGHFDPVTRVALRESDLIPNYAMKEAIENFLNENPWAKFDPSVE